MVFGLSSQLRCALSVFASIMLFATLVAEAPDVGAQQESVEQVNDQLGMGINLGTALELDREGERGLTLRSEFFSTIAQRGFGHVRVPIQFSAYAASTAPYTIPAGDDPTVPNAANLWERIDWVIANAEDNGLYVILDVHLYDELSQDIVGERDRFLAIWDQIATRYADAGPLVLFELLNEPHDQFNDDPALYNALVADALALVRTTNPSRPILVGPVWWNSIFWLDSLELPDDPNLIVSLHFYDPFDFTHQGATWLDPIPPAPTAFQADIVDFGAGWSNWAWNSNVVSAIDALEVTFGGQWAGIGFGSRGWIDPQELTVTVSGDAELRVLCVDELAESIEVDEITATDTATTFTVDMTDCSAQTQAISFMMASPTFDELRFTAAEVCDAAGRCRRLVENGAQAIESAFDVAQEWGQANGRPINIGEFGVFAANGVANLNERAEWTQLVREAGRSRNFSMTYWEFGAGFGAFDLQTDTWVGPLVEALGVVSTAVAKGDANCDGAVTIADAILIAQYSAGNRQAVASCPLGDRSSQISAGSADVSGDGQVSLLDALLVAECSVGNRDCSR